MKVEEEWMDFGEEEWEKPKNSFMCINLVVLLLLGGSESIIGTEIRREREREREKALRDGYGC